MINEGDYAARGWAVVPAYIGERFLSQALLDEMGAHPECPGESSWGTRNMLFSTILSMRPKVIVEIGSHIGSGTVVMGAALRANGFGKLYSLEPQDHYFDILSMFIRKAGLTDYVTPLKMFSTDTALQPRIREKADIVFLDANHSYSHALRDIAVSVDLLADNGLIFLDDVGDPHSGAICQEKRGGVRQALLDFTKDRRDLKITFFEPPFWLNPCGLALVCKQRL
jgi:predicted O-methyltransferase YrrM